MAEHKKQHYIPQCYLRLFSDDKEHLWVYDKENKRSYGALISDICTINHFYTISEEYLTNNPGLTPLTLEEEYFANEYESKYDHYLSKIITLANLAVENSVGILKLSEEDKYVFAYLIAIQWLRLPTIRYQLESMLDDVMPQMLKLAKYGLSKELNNPDIQELEIKAEIADKAVYHARCTFLDDDLVDTYASMLSHNIWTFTYSPKGDFYTSDFPITVNPHVQNVRPICDGLTQYGAELTFPISKYLSLTIWDNDYFKEKINEDCSLKIAEDREIRAFNAVRFKYAIRQLFCSKDDFVVVDYLSKNSLDFISPFKR